MLVAEAKLTRKGQLTVPKLIRDRLGIRPGDLLEFVEDDHVIYVRKRPTRSPFDRYVGLLGHQSGRDPDAIVEELRGGE
jgi:AbrB family looped-hinge helix DNA binding protein